MTNFRKFITKSRAIVLAGKDAETNEKLVCQFIGKNNIILHTASPGSPFCVISELKEKKSDIKEAAVFCAKYSHYWKKNKSDVLIHKFKGEDIYKTKDMKTGTFGVKKFKSIKVKKEEIEDFKN